MNVLKTAKRMRKYRVAVVTTQLIRTITFYDVNARSGNEADLKVWEGKMGPPVEKARLLSNTTSKKIPMPGVIEVNKIPAAANLTLEEWMKMVERRNEHAT